MKVEIIQPVNLGFRGYGSGECPDVPEIVAEAWLNAGKAKRLGNAAPVASSVDMPPAVPGETVVETVDSLCAKYTVAALRQMYEARTGKKAHHKQHERALAEAILAAGN